LALVALLAALVSLPVLELLPHQVQQGQRSQLAAANRKVLLSLLQSYHQQEQDQLRSRQASRRIVTTRHAATAQRNERSDSNVSNLPRVRKRRRRKWLLRANHRPPLQEV
jgi:hypothetical protein